MYDIAILQGRLSPDYDNRFQFFPNTWPGELNIAASLGFSGIEWLVDPKNWKSNPIFNKHLDIRDLPITSICADWFMEVPFWENTDDHLYHLNLLIRIARHTRNKLILVPLLETHTITDTNRWSKAVDLFNKVANMLNTFGVRIGFETELSANVSLDFLSQLSSPCFGIYYDTGNATSYGFNCSEEIKLLNKSLFGVHLKDRKRHSSQSVPLGEGDTDFKSVFSALRQTNWKGNPVLQAWRGKDFLTDAKTQLGYIQDIQKEI